MNKLKSCRYKHDERKEKLKQKLNGKTFQTFFQPCLQTQKIYIQQTICLMYQMNKTVLALL